jgi:hypothetical protein
MRKYAPQKMQDALAHMNLTSVARAARLSAATMSRAKKGRKLNPDSIGAIASVLDKSVDDFYEETPDGRTSPRP